MAWFNVDDRIWAHPKFIGLPDRALALWVKAGAYCAQHLTDGVVPAGVLPLLGATEPAVADLTERGLWHPTEGGYQFHDWADWQRTREQVKADRAAAKERQRKWRERRANGKHQPSAANRPADRSVAEVLAHLEHQMGSSTDGD